MTAKGRRAVAAWIALAVGFACTVGVTYDIYGRDYRQRMSVMEWVWPVTALYAGPLGVWLYVRFGRPVSARWQEEHGTDGAPEKPAWKAM